MRRAMVYLLLVVAFGLIVLGFTTFVTPVQAIFVHLAGGFVAASSLVLAQMKK